MEIIENYIAEEYKNYFDTKMFFQNEELDSWMDMAARSKYQDPTSSPDGACKYGYNDLSSPEGAASSLAASKNTVSERNRRKKLADRLLALRKAVPKITKLDKASIIKDAIDYIQELHEQERRIQAEIKELETEKLKRNNPGYSFDEDEELPSKRKRIDQFYNYRACKTSPIEGLELGIDYMGEKTMLVRLKCVKRTDTMVKLCEVFEALKLKIITTNITTVSGKLLKTVIIEANEEERDCLKTRIQTVIAALNDSQNPMIM